MDGNALIAEAARLGVPLLEQELMKNHTTFRVGGPACWFAAPKTARQLWLLLSAARESNIPCVVIGNGSNLLAPDEGYAGLVLRTPDGVIEREGDTLRASAGTLLSKVAQAALEYGLSGMEFAGGIPGTVGGAVVMNAGAYGGEISQVLRESTARTETGDLTRLSNAGHAFGYRQSVYKSHPAWICEEASFTLHPDDPSAIRARMEDFAARRREKQPLELPSAGSVYKRPEGCFAGKLIEDCELKGFTVGGAQVSMKHAGFIVNIGGASCADVLAVMAHIEETVFLRFGVRLEREVRLLT